MKNTFSFLSALLLFVFLSYSSASAQYAILFPSGGTIVGQVQSISGFGLVVSSSQDAPYTLPMSSIELVGDAKNLQSGDYVRVVGLGQSQNDPNLKGNLKDNKGKGRDFRVVKINHPFENVVISH